MKMFKNIKNLTLFTGRVYTNILIYVRCNIHFNMHGVSNIAITTSSAIVTIIPELYCMEEII